MTINKTLNEGNMILSLEGWLDTQAAPELQEIIEGMTDEVKSVVFDCEKLEYISSSGIRQIVAAYKKAGGNCTLKNVSDEIMDVLNMTGIANRIKVE